MEKKKPSVIQGGWSKWRYEPCSSGCIAKGRGYMAKRRTCNNPRPINTEDGCEGNSYEVVLCKDDKVCKITSLNFMSF